MPCCVHCARVKLSNFIHRYPTEFALTAATVMIAQQAAGKAARDALFLSHFDVTQLPKVMIAAAMISLLGVLAMSRLRTRLGPARAGTRRRWCRRHQWFLVIDQRTLRPTHSEIAHCTNRRRSCAGRPARWCGGTFCRLVAWLSEHAGAAFAPRAVLLRFRGPWSSYAKVKATLALWWRRFWLPVSVQFAAFGRTSPRDCATSRIFFSNDGVGLPSTARPFFFWKARIPPRVPEPMTPSTAPMS